jgi:hypothetical protein
MTSEAGGVSQGSAVGKMVKSRSKSAVLKMDLMHLRERYPEGCILVFEGKNDRGVFSQWIRQIRAGLKYEPFVCNGKGQLLGLRTAVKRDLHALGEGVYFFVDRDFDDLRGQDSDSSVMMTDAYSTENYLVCEEVLDSVLLHEFGCDGFPDVREKVIEKFGEIFDDFLAITSEINRRIHHARQKNIEILGGLPDRAADLATITIDGVSHAAAPPADLVRLEREIDLVDAALLDPIFETLDPRTRYRGKFAYLFFMSWLQLLAQERIKPDAKLFVGCRRQSTVAFNGLTMELLASRAPPPPCFATFIGSIPQH